MYDYENSPTEKEHEHSFHNNLTFGNLLSFLRFVFQGNYFDLLWYVTL